MRLLFVLLRPSARWLALIAILPVLAGGIAVAPHADAPVAAVACIQARQTPAAVAAVPRLVDPGTVAAVDPAPAGPRLHRSDRLASRAPPRG